MVLLFVVYELFVTDLVAAGDQADLSEQLRHEWSAGPVTDRPAVPGDALAVLYLPRLGADYRRVVLEGAAEEQLSKGPGHYPGTAMPGERGNLAIAGHRVGRGSPFLDLDRLRPGDAIVVETVDTWFVYRVLGDRRTGSFQGDSSGIPGREIVRPTNVDVISPVPGGPAHAKPDGAWLTLTTCHPKYSAEQRLVIHAVLTDEGALKTDAPDGPPALRED